MPLNFLGIFIAQNFHSVSVFRLYFICLTEYHCNPPSPYKLSLFGGDRNGTEIPLAMTECCVHLFICFSWEIILLGQAEEKKMIKAHPILHTCFDFHF